MTKSEQPATRLVAVDDLGDSHVAVVDNTPHGALAVGISAGIFEAAPAPWRRTVVAAAPTLEAVAAEVARLAHNEVRP